MPIGVRDDLGLVELGAVTAMQRTQRVDPSPVPVPEHRDGHRSAPVRVSPRRGQQFQLTGRGGGEALLHTRLLGGDHRGGRLVDRQTAPEPVGFGVVIDQHGLAALVPLQAVQREVEDVFRSTAGVDADLDCGLEFGRPQAVQIGAQHGHDLRREVPPGFAAVRFGGDLPPEIMAVLSANLDGLRPAELKAAIQIGIDTGRRPEDILNLPLDCLQRDKGGEPVLVYDNAKADRLGRRLPINEATAAVITAQQSRVQQRFPATPAGELKLLPSPRRNPDGRRPMTIAMLGDGNRRWVDTLGPLHSRDGAEFDKSKIVPYAYRHSYAQRHADAGVGIDVLAELLDHRNLNVTRTYYRVGEDRRRAAVDTVTAMSFDRHGNRVWREAAALLDSEHARYAVGEVAVPYG